MPEICEYEKIPKLVTVEISVGGVARGASDLRDLKNTEWVKVIKADSKEAPGVDVVLPLIIVRKILESPDVYEKRYDIEVPKMDPEDIERFEEGLLLQRNPIGPILSCSSEKKLYEATQSAFKLATKGADKARDQNVPVLKDQQFNCIASTGGGTGSAIILPHCSAIKRDYPKDRVNLITTFDFIAEAIPNVEARETIIRNMRNFLEELVALEEGNEK